MALSLSFSSAPNLRSIHVNFPMEKQEEDDLPILRQEEALQIVQQCNPSIQQFGCNTRVWQVLCSLLKLFAKIDFSISGEQEDSR